MRSSQSGRWTTVAVASILAIAIWQLTRTPAAPEEAPSEEQSGGTRAPVRVDPERLRELRGGLEAQLLAAIGDPPRASVLLHVVRALGPKRVLGEAPAIDQLVTELRVTESDPPTFAGTHSQAALDTSEALVTLLEAGVELSTSFAGPTRSWPLSELVELHLKRGTSPPLEPANFRDHAERLNASSLLVARLPSDAPGRQTLRTELVDLTNALELAQRSLLAFRGRGKPDAAARAGLWREYSESRGLYADPDAGFSLMRAVWRGHSILRDTEFETRAASLYGDLMFRADLERALAAEHLPPQGLRYGALEARTLRHLAELLQTLGFSQLVLRGNGTPPQSYLDTFHSALDELLRRRDSSGADGLGEGEAERRLSLDSALIRALRLAEKILQIGTPR